MFERVTERNGFTVGTVMDPPVPVSCRLPELSPIPTVKGPQEASDLGFINPAISKLNKVPAFS